MASILYDYVTPLSGGAADLPSVEAAAGNLATKADAT